MSGDGLVTGVFVLAPLALPGISENASPLPQGELLGTVQYLAPEYLLGEGGDARSDLYSLGVIAYQMLSGRLPYGADAARARTRAAQRQLLCASMLADDREIPARCCARPCIRILPADTWNYRNSSTISGIQSRHT